MRKLISYVAIFVLGFAACAWILSYKYGPQTPYQPFQPDNAVSRPAPPMAAAGSDVVRKSAAMVSQVVVNINTRGRAQGGPGFPFDIFDFPFGRPQPPVPQGRASGVIIRPDGYILTNNHVVENTQARMVTLANGKTYSARLVGVDPRTDLAVIKIDARNLPYAKFTKNSMVVGDWVIAVGNALGLGPTVTVGVVSATRRDVDIDGRVLEGMVQTDAAINPGNSGGALADLNGNIVGINTAIASTSPGGGNIGIGFATPANTAMKIANELIKRGHIVRPWLGVYYSEMTDELREAYAQQGSRPPKGGMIVREVAPDSPAAAAGIRQYDIILEIDRKRITDRNTVADTISGHKVGQKIMLLVWRNGESRIIAVTLGEAPSQMG